MLRKPLAFLEPTVLSTKMISVNIPSSEIDRLGDIYEKNFGVKLQRESLVSLGNNLVYLVNILADNRVTTPIKIHVNEDESSNIQTKITRE